MPFLQIDLRIFEGMLSGQSEQCLAVMRGHVEISYPTFSIRAALPELLEPQPEDAQRVMSIVLCPRSTPEGAIAIRAHDDIRLLAITIGGETHRLHQAANDATVQARVARNSFERRRRAEYGRMHAEIDRWIDTTVPALRQRAEKLTDPDVRYDALAYLAEATDPGKGAQNRLFSLMCAHIKMGQQPSGVLVIEE